MATAAAGVGHFQPRANILTRSKGNTVTGKAAYNARCRIENERTGQVSSFSHLPNKIISEHFYPAANAPEWAQTRQGYWNGVELRENRADSQLAMDWVIDLPHQLQANPDHARMALQDFIRENFTRKGYGADLAFHPAHDHGDERNFHAHLMVGIRKFEKDGSWSKTKDGVPDPHELTELRRRMADKLNRHLERHGYGIQVDHRSNEARGIERESTVHMGRAAAALERLGVQTEVGNLNRAIQVRNAESEKVLVKVRVKELEPIEVESAIERQRQEDQAHKVEVQKRADRDLARSTGMAQHARDIMRAVSRLFVTMGATLGNIIQIDRGDIRGQGATFRTEAIDKRRKLEELEATSYKRQMDENTQKLAAAALAQAQPQQPQEAPKRKYVHEEDLERERRAKAEQKPEGEQPKRKYVHEEDLRRGLSRPGRRPEDDEPR